MKKINHRNSSIRMSWIDDVIKITTKNPKNDVSIERSNQVLSNYTIFEHVRGGYKLRVLGTIVLKLAIIDVIKNGTYGQN